MERKAIIINSIILAALVLTGVTNKSAQNTVKPGKSIQEKPRVFSTNYLWKKLDTQTFKGKQDDIFFVTPEVGWYVNGAGKIYKTIDGGAKWIEKFNQPGTYFRCIGFIDELRGFAGNIGPDYFPNVTDTVPLYETSDGGETWKPVYLGAINTKGLCTIDILKMPFINAGRLDYKTYLFAAGRVGGPVSFLKSADGGKTWQQIDMSRYCGMILDVKFFSPQIGIIAAASSADVRESHALILMTKDGDKTWSKRYEGTRPYELTWKASFPNRKVGYVTVQSYNPDPATSQRFVAKTTDGGETWKEINLANDAKMREFGIGFISDKVGWVGAVPNGYQTIDGGKTWTPLDIGRATNKIRLLKTPDGFVGYAVGVDVYKLEYKSAGKHLTARSKAVK